MSSTVREIMNRELFYLRGEDSAASVRTCILGMEITAAPVLDERGRPLGVVSLRDLLGAGEDKTAAQLMSSPAAVVRAGARIREAARLIGETGYRRLVVVDDAGVAVGMLSAVDVVRGLIGMPARHPASFPRFDADTRLAWTADTPLAEEWVETVPDGAGLLVLIHDAPEQPARIIWVEWTHNLRTRVCDVLSSPQDSHELARLLEHRDHVYFRAAALADRRRGAELVRAMRPHLGPVLNPRAVG